MKQLIFLQTRQTPRTGIVVTPEVLDDLKDASAPLGVRAFNVDVVTDVEEAKAYLDVRAAAPKTSEDRGRHALRLLQLVKEGLFEGVNKDDHALGIEEDFESLATRIAAVFGLDTDRCTYCDDVFATIDVRFDRENNPVCPGCWDERLR